MDKKQKKLYKKCSELFHSIAPALVIVIGLFFCSLGTKNEPRPKENCTCSCYYAEKFERGKEISCSEKRANIKQVCTYTIGPRPIYAHLRGLQSKRTSFKREIHCKDKILSTRDKE